MFTNISERALARPRARFFQGWTQCVPGLQTKPHSPPLHVAVPPGAVGQTMPHPPQLLTSVEVFTHWPPQASSPVLQGTNSSNVTCPDPGVQEAMTMLLVSPV